MHGNIWDRWKPTTIRLTTSRDVEDCGLHNRSVMHSNMMVYATLPIERNNYVLSATDFLTNDNWKIQGSLL